MVGEISYAFISFAMLCQNRVFPKFSDVLFPLLQNKKFRQNIKKETFWKFVNKITLN